jgi:hypothetical protein
MAVVTPVADRERVSGIRMGRRFIDGPEGCEGSLCCGSTENEALAEKTTAARRMISLSG